MPRLHILSYEIAQGVLRSEAAAEVTHVVSINDPETQPPRALEDHGGEHLVLLFHDICEPYKGMKCPTKEDVRRIVKFGSLLEDHHRVLVHCAAGISRSSAAALTILAGQLVPSKRSADLAVRKLLEIKEAIHPNKLMVCFADELLGYDGHLKAAVENAFGGFKLYLPNFEPDEDTLADDE